MAFGTGRCRTYAIVFGVYGQHDRLNGEHHMSPSQRADLTLHGWPSGFDSHNLPESILPISTPL